ncbi:MAG TPA: PAS domain-containing protein, partial [Bacteroidales bacterium]|nr:PAS domain-containing protein [Bacteroidales bacterium]
MIDIPRLFKHDPLPEIDYRQISSFFYDQLIDAFIFLTTDLPVDWNNYPQNSARLKILSDKFVISKVNDALTLQCGRNEKEIIGNTLGHFYGKYFRENLDAWNNLIDHGEVFAEFTLLKKDGSPLWVEASYRFVKDDLKRTIGIIAVQ